MTLASRWYSAEMPWGHVRIFFLAIGSTLFYGAGLTAGDDFTLIGSPPPLESKISNTADWRHYLEKWVKKLEKGENPTEILRNYDLMRKHFSSLGAEVALANPHHYADLQVMEGLHLDLLYWKSKRVIKKKSPPRESLLVLEKMKNLEAPLEDRMDLLEYLGKDRLYLQALKQVLEAWERFPEKMKRPRPFPPRLRVKDSWGREECYDALAILDLAFKSNWKPTVTKWESIALPLAKSFISMGLARYGKDVLDLHPEGDQSDSLKLIRAKIEGMLSSSEVDSSDGSDLY